MKHARRAVPREAGEDRPLLGFPSWGRVFPGFPRRLLGVRCLPTPAPLGAALASGSPCVPSWPEGRQESRSRDASLGGAGGRVGVPKGGLLLVGGTPRRGIGGDLLPPGVRGRSGVGRGAVSGARRVSARRKTQPGTTESPSTLRKSSSNVPTCPASRSRAMATTAQSARDILVRRCVRKRSTARAK
jgi:hypothetical protein